MIKAVIFDLNGTVLSDEENYGYAFKRVLVSLGVRVEDDFPHIEGIGVEENWPNLIKEYNVKTDKTVEELVVLTQQAYLSQIEEIELKPGFMDFAQDLKDSEIRVALATSNNWDVVEKVLEKHHLLDFFDVITTKEEVEENKPNPMIFILTADKLMIDHEMCLVIEDSRSGVSAAKQAGMKVVGISRDRKHRKDLDDADLIIEDFLEISLETLKRF